MSDFTAARIPEVDGEGVRRARERAGSLLMPQRALGRLLDLGEQVAGIVGFPIPDLSLKTIEFHRNGIRVKLGLKDKKTHLRVHLLGLS